MAIKLNNFDYDTVENYYQKNILENNFWIFGANALELLTPISKNTPFQETDFLYKTIFGSKLGTNDIAFMLSSVLWERNIVYAAYDDQENLIGKNFYTIVKPDIESGSYQVFKCISNNNNSPSITKPEFNSSINLLDGLYSLNDGYVWKYMTSIPFSLHKKFATRSYTPLVRNQQVEQIANDGIYSILIENLESNSGYNELNGSIARTSVTSDSYRIYIQSTTIFEQFQNNYVNRVLYIEKFQPSPDIGGRTFKIISSGSDGLNNNYVDIEYIAYEGFTINTDDIIKILPQIKITGDGTGAVAIPILDSFNKITNIEILNPGTGYTKAIAEVVNPINFDPTNANRLDIKCILRPIISPAGGHGSNLYKELNSKHIGISKNITSLNLTNIPSTNKYSKIGLVKNPSFGIFTKINTTAVQAGVNVISLDNVTGILPGMAVKFGNSIPKNTIVTDVSSTDIFLSSKVEIIIPQLSNIEFTNVTGTFDNRLKITVTSDISDVLANDMVMQINPLTNETITGYIHEVDYTNKVLYIIEYDGPHRATFKAVETVDGSDVALNLLIRNVSRSINNEISPINKQIKYSPYQSGTGSVLFISDFTPVNRTTDKIEQIKLVIDF